MNYKNILLVVMSFGLIAGLVTEVSAATRRCPITGVRNIQERDGTMSTVVMCNEFFGTLTPGALVRKTGGQVVDIHDVEFPVHAVLYTKIIGGEEIITGIKIGTPADPEEITYDDK